MAGLTGTQIKATYGDVLQCNNAGAGIPAAGKVIQDGLGNNTALQLSPTQCLAPAGSLTAVGWGFQGASNGRLGMFTRDGSVVLCFTQSGVCIYEATSNKIEVQNGLVICWSSTGQAVGTAAPDAGIRRVAAGVIAPTTGNNTTGGWIQNAAGDAALASAFTNATATLAATALSFNVQAGRSYRIRGVLQVSNSTPAEGIQLAFDGGGATATTFFASATLNGTGVAGTLTTTTLAGVINWTSITGTDYITIDGYLKVNAAGTFILRAAENTTATGTLTIGAGSWLSLTDLVTL